MYESFYGFSAKPFSLLPDADFLYPSKAHKRVVNMLEYGVISQAGFVVISGEVGAGKTTIVRRFLKNAGPQVVIGSITNPSASLGRLLVWIAHAFDIKTQTQDATDLYNGFVSFLLEQYAKGKRTILVIDEAQNLTMEMLEELRMLSNVNNERDMLLQVVLVGQPELLHALKKPELRQFVQRISVHYHLGPLSAPETAAYIRYRVTRVKGDPHLFDDEACAAVYRFTGGVPRLINLLCDHALVYGFSEDMKNIPAVLVAEVAIDRGRSGLSAFVNVPDAFSPEKFQAELKPILAQIQNPQSSSGEKAAS
jgi:general secretion pathway protein A